jgi:hypothetical protein
MNNQERRTYSSEFERINRKFEAKWFPKVEKTLKGKVSSLINIVKARGVQAGMDALAVDLINKDLHDTVKDLYLEVGLRHARKTYRHIKQDVGRKSYASQVETKGFGFNADWAAFILNYLQEFLTSKITFDVNATTREKLLEVLQQGVADGLSIEEMVNQLEDLPFIPFQTARIVRTEINRAANVGTMAAVDTSEYEMNKEWISAHDRRTRGNPMTGQNDHADHWNMNGLVVGYEEKFTDTRSKTQLSFPGDPEAGAADTVNCRCSVAPIAKRDQNGRLIPKAQPAVYTPVLGIYKPPIAAGPYVGLRVGN